MIKYFLSQTSLNFEEVKPVQIVRDYEIFVNYTEYVCGKRRERIRTKRD